jgi:hypothetical protein
MGAAGVEIPQSELFENTAQVALPQDDHVVEALLPDAAQKSLYDRVHQGGPHCRLDDPNARPFRDPIELSPVLVVPVADDELRPLCQWSGVAKLLCRLLLTRVVGCRQVHHPLTVDVHDEEAEDRSKPDVVGLQEIARPNGVVA